MAETTQPTIVYRGLADVPVKATLKRERGAAGDQLPALDDEQPADWAELEQLAFYRAYEGLLESARGQQWRRAVAGHCLLAPDWDACAVDCSKLRAGARRLQDLEDRAAVLSSSGQLLLLIERRRRREASVATLP